MNPYLVTSGIRLNDCWFTEPVNLANWRPPEYAGLFAVFVRDTSWAPKPYRPLCFGEFGNNVPRAALLPNYTELQSTAGGSELLISVCPVPFSTTAQRWALREQLVWAYNPPCQAEGQETQKLLPEPRKEPRRRIGFTPEYEPAR